jgi:geranylgeranyl diphosphate synthase type II
MYSFKELAARFTEWFGATQYPATPESLYGPGSYFLQLGGKRIRPILCLLGNTLFGELNPDALHAATAVELFHNFTLVHDDIMDRAPLRRGMATVHARYGENTAILSGDVMLIVAYEHLGKVNPVHLPALLALFNTTAREVCEGQQYDMDFETQEQVQLEEYIRMIELKTSVLLAASLQMGAILADAAATDSRHLYEFGKNLGIAFQVQDDYLDAFGDPEKFGKDVGGDIRQNKKTFLLIHALETCNETQRQELEGLLQGQADTKVVEVLRIFRACGVDAWADQLKEAYYRKALEHLEAIGVPDGRKQPLRELAAYLLQRES